MAMWRMVGVVAAGLVMAACGPAALARDAGRGVLDAVDAQAGVCVVLGWDDGKAPLALARSGRFLTHVLEPEPGLVQQGWAAANAAGLTIQQLLIEHGRGDALPHAGNSVDVVVLQAAGDSGLAACNFDEAMRVLRPAGQVVVRGRTVSRGAVRRWFKARGVEDCELRTWPGETLGWAHKAVPEGMDAWTHWEHRPDNNAVSTDAVIRAPYMTQWLGKPYYIAMPAITLAAGGRTFTAMGHIAHHEREEPWLNTLLARNGYNGFELWRKKLPDGYLAHRSAFIALEDAFLMIAPDGAGIHILDPETGEIEERVVFDALPGAWKWIALDDGVLYVLAGAQPDPPETTLVRSEIRAWSWGELSRGYYAPRVPWGFGHCIAACDLDAREVLWTHEETAPIDSRAMAVGGGKLFFYCPDACLGALDKKTGGRVWRNEHQKLRTLIEEPGRGLGSTPGFRSTCFCVYTPKGLFYEAQTRQHLVAVSPDTGDYLWHKKKTTNNPNPIYADGRIHVGIGPGGSTVTLEPETGALVEDLGFGKRSCARLTATPDSFFCRGMPEGTTRYDRATGKIFFNGAVRPACNDGVIGANGLLYIGPWLCDCNLTLMGTLSLCSAGDFNFAPAPEAARMVRYVEAEQNLSVTPADWPTYRGDNARSAASRAAIPEQADRLWHYAPARPYAPAPPVAAGGLLFIAGEDGVVRAVDMNRGGEAWRFQTRGPIIQAPSVWEGRVYVGAGDGCVYAIEAATGRGLWRFQAAPVERRIMLYGALSSTWPVNTGVLIEDGTAYAAAGLVDYDGTYVYALDAATGAVKWCNADCGHLDPELRKGVSAQGGLTLAGGCLWMAGGNVVSPAPFELATGAYQGPPAGDGSPRANRGQEVGVLGGDHLVFGGRLLYSARENVVNPGSFAIAPVHPDGSLGRPATWAGGRIAPAWNDTHAFVVNGRRTQPQCQRLEAVKAFAAQDDSDVRPEALWRADLPADSDPVSLAVTPNAALVVGSAPMYRSRYRRWFVQAYALETGAALWERELPGPALPGGLLVDRDGRVVVALEDGGVMCYGGPAHLEAEIDRLYELAQQEGPGKEAACAALQQMMFSAASGETRGMILERLMALGEDPASQAKRDGRLTQWRILGPVPWDREAHGYDAAIVGEPDLDGETACEAGGEIFAWQEQVTCDRHGKVDLAAMLGPHEWVVAYAYAVFELDEARDLVVHVGSNDGFVCWFNGDEAGRYEDGRGYAPDIDALPVKGRAGTNVVLLKIMQHGARWAFSVRVTDAAGRPVDLS